MQCLQLARLVIAFRQQAWDLSITCFLGSSLTFITFVTLVTVVDHMLPWLFPQIYNICHIGHSCLSHASLALPSCLQGIVPLGWGLHHMPAELIFIKIFHNIFFNRPGPKAGSIHNIEVSVCLCACMLVPPHIFFHDGCPTLPIYLGPPIFLQIPDPL